ncbi:MAG TPA: ABC transporter permease [Acidimicrobiia bacterium]
MLKFFLRRLLAIIPIVFGVIVVVFLTLKLIPGDPASALLGASATPSQRKQLIADLGLNRSIFVQFWNWFLAVLQGDLGHSILRQQPVGPMVMDAFWNTMILAVGASVIAIVGGLVIGGASALWPRTLFGRACNWIATGSVSTPQYSIGLGLIVIFAVNWEILPASGMYSSTGPQNFWDLLQHLILPAIAAGLAPMGIVARVFRSSLDDVMRADFVESYRARGAPSRKVLTHAAHNTMPALLTISGLQFGYLISGVVFVETIFSWPGLGLLIYNSIAQRDYPVIEGGVLILAVALVLINVLVDTAHAAIDPRVRPA